MKRYDMRFYDREMELKRLSAATDRALEGGGRLTVVTGRRRVGKTELIRRHMARREQESVYLFVGRRHGALLQEEFARVVAARHPELSGAVFPRVADLIRSLLVSSRRRPLLLVMDEFQNFLHVDAGFFSELQSIWDELHHDIRCHLIVAGSAYTLMKQIFEDRKEPLFGRATDKLFIEPFTPSVVGEVLADHGRSDDLLRFWAVFGGIPRYYELIDKYGLFEVGLEEILRELVLDRSSVLYREGGDLLLEEFGRGYPAHFSVLSAIARGHTQMGRIADAAGIPGNSVGRYLDQLQHRYELVERRTPMLERESRKGAYYIRDRFLAFWFRYVHRNASFLEVGDTDLVVRQVTEDLPNFLGPSFEALCRAVIRERSRGGERPFGLAIEQLGGWWDRGRHEIDVTAVAGETVLLMECKLSSRRLTSEALRSFQRSCEAFARRHPHHRQVHVAVTHDEPDAGCRTRWREQGIRVISFEELLAGESYG